MISEVIAITVTDKVKSIAGINWLGVRDVVKKIGELVEHTDRNLWYWGGEVIEHKTFERDQPPDSELVAIRGFFNAGREGELRLYSGSPSGHGGIRSNSRCPVWALVDSGLVRAVLLTN